MLTILNLDGKPSVAAFCEVCGHQIDDAEHGVAVFEKPGSPLVFLHHDCEKEDTAHHFSLPLDVALLQLARGLQIDWTEAAENEQRHGLTVG